MGDNIPHSMAHDVGVVWLLQKVVGVEVKGLLLAVLVALRSHDYRKRFCPAVAANFFQDLVAVHDRHDQVQQNNANFFVIGFYVFPSLNAIGRLGNVKFLLEHLRQNHSA